MSQSAGALEAGRGAFLLGIAGVSNRSLPYLADGDGATPLHICADRNWPDGARFLLHAKADVRARDAQGRDACICAAARSHHRVVRVLLHNGYPPKSAATHGLRQTALMAAAQSNSVKSIVLLWEASCDVAATDSLGKTALHIAITQGASAGTVALLAGLSLDSAITNGQKSRLSSTTEGGLMDLREELKLCKESGRVSDGRMLSGQLTMMNLMQSGLMAGAFLDEMRACVGLPASDKDEHKLFIWGVALRLRRAEHEERRRRRERKREKKRANQAAAEAAARGERHPTSARLSFVAAPMRAFRALSMDSSREAPEGGSPRLLLDQDEDSGDDDDGGGSSPSPSEIIARRENARDEATASKEYAWVDDKDQTRRKRVHHWMAWQSRPVAAALGGKQGGISTGENFNGEDETDDGSSSAVAAEAEPAELIPNLGDGDVGRGSSLDAMLGSSGDEEDGGLEGEAGGSDAAAHPSAGRRLSPLMQSTRLPTPDELEILLYETSVRGIEEDARDRHAAEFFLLSAAHGHGRRSIEYASAGGLIEEGETLVAIDHEEEASSPASQPQARGLRGRSMSMPNLASPQRQVAPPYMLTEARLKAHTRKFDKRRAGSPDAAGAAR